MNIMSLLRVLVWAALTVGSARSVVLQNDELEQEFISQLDTAIQLFQNAVLTIPPVTEANCNSQVQNALRELSWVKTHVKEDSLDHSTIQLHLRSAIQDVAKCANQSLFLSAGLAKVEAVTKWFWRTFHDNQSDVGNSYIENNKGDKDGTTCQYLGSGRGQKLVNCVYGYASGVTGGAGGKLYVVTNPHDDPQNPINGSLRFGVNLSRKTNGGIWITFSRDLFIVLQDMLWVYNSTTIDGRSFNITISGASIVMGRVSNIIIHNLQINDLGQSDAIHIFAHSTQIWIDHITSFNANLGLFSVLQGSTDITISNSFLTNPNFNVLLGASDADDEDKDMRVTIFRNWFKDSMQRMPHCRWGVCHVINNLYTNWGYYALGGRVYGKIYSEHNVYIAHRRLEVTSWHPGVDKNFDQTATIISSYDLLVNGSTFHQSPNTGPTLPYYKHQSHYPPKISTEILTNVLQHCVGALFGQKLELCLLAIG